MTDINRLAYRIVERATAEGKEMERKPIELEIAIAHLLNTDNDWGNIIRACVEWSDELRKKGSLGQFTRESLYFRLGRVKGEGPKLTPLVKAGVLKKAWTNAKGKPYYELAHEPRVILNALSRAIGKAR